MSNSHLFLKSGFLRAPLQNGVGRYVCQLQRIVFKFCKSNGASRGMREFIENDLLTLAREQPGVVIYLKPRRHHSPIIVGEYLNGERKWMSAHCMSREELIGFTQTLLGSSGGESIRLRKLQSTAHPSVQGPWVPTPTPPAPPHKSAAYTRLLELAAQQNIVTEQS